MKKGIEIGTILLVVAVAIVGMIVLGKMRSPKLEANGNVSNMGLVLEYQGVIYYNKYEKGIFAVKDGNETRLTEETAYCLMAENGKLYYMTVADFNNVVIKSIDLESGTVKNIATVYTSMSKFFVQDQWIYYFTNNGENGICKMDSNGENETMILSGNVQDFQLEDNEIYYVDETGQIGKFSLKNEENSVLSEAAGARKIQVVDDWIYYYAQEENALFRVSTDGKKQELVSVLIHHETYNVCGKYVYYFDAENQKIARMRLNKSNQCDDIVSLESARTKLNVAGDVLYYLDKSKDESQNYQMHRVKLNGEKMQDVEY